VPAPEHEMTTRDLYLEAYSYEGSGPASFVVNCRAETGRSISR
jgi:hypothetical protein